MYKDKVVVQAYISKELYEKLSAAVQRDDVSVSKYIARLIKQNLDNTPNTNNVI